MSEQQTDALPLAEEQTKTLPIKAAYVFVAEKSGYAGLRAREAKMAENELVKTIDAAPQAWGRAWVRSVRSD